MVDELLLGPIIGGLKHDQAYLWGRIAAEAAEQQSRAVRLHAWIGSAPDLSDARLAGRSLPLGQESGYAGVAVAAGLSPDTQYHYCLSLAGRPPKSTPGGFPSFTTAPNPGTRTAFSFAFGSCFNPAAADSGQIFTAMDNMRKASSPAMELRFGLMIGDQIYADDYRRNGIGKIAVSLQEYRDVYSYVWSRPALRQIMRNLPMYMTLDDHEVDDDWQWRDPERQWAAIPWWDRAIRWVQRRPASERQISRQRVRDALQAYWEHQGMHAPGYELPMNLIPNGQYSMEARDPGSLAYTFTWGAAAFFVLDTRTMRVRSRKQHSMLGEGQWQALITWLHAVKDAFPVKFIVSSGTLLHDFWADIPKDRWPGFPQERDRLLHTIAVNGIEGVHILTGDLHTAHAVFAELYGPQGRRLPVWEFCSTPFEQSSSRLTSLTFNSRPFGPVQRLKRRFCIPQHNFGVVRVGYAPSGRAVVRFEVYGKNGEKLGQAGS